MAQVIASISSVNGIFYVKHPDGSRVELHEGDKIYEGDIVIGEDSNNPMSNIIISLQDGSEMILLAGDEQLFDASLTQEIFSVDETVTAISAVSTLAEIGNISEITSDISTDEIETSVNDIESRTHSSDTGDGNFQQIDIQDIKIDTKLSDFEPFAKTMTLEEDRSETVVNDAVEAEMDSDKDGSTNEEYNASIASNETENIDLSNLEENVRKIDVNELNENENDVVDIKLEDVLDITGSDNILRIDGDKEDMISLDIIDKEVDDQGNEDGQEQEDDSGEWKLGDFKTDAESGDTYQEYIATSDDGSSVTIEVNTDIHVDEY
jgi:hypothetical protein